MSDTIRQITGRVLLRCPMLSPLLATDFLRDAWRKLANRKRAWSWLTATSQMVFPNEMTTGTVTVTLNSNQVVGDATASAAWTAALVGLQFRIGVNAPIYTVIAFDGVSTLTLDQVWGSTTQAAIGYEIYAAYQTMPADFVSFQTCWDPSLAWRLWANTITQADLNMLDPQRATSGNPYACVFRDFDPTGLTSPPRARYEIWPHRKSAYVLPFIYVKQFVDVDDSTFTLPYLIQGDILVQGALAEVAQWPGPDLDHRNPYFNPVLARDHELKFERGIAELERQDDNVFEQDVTYQTSTAGLPMAPWPIDSRFMQSHLMYGMPLQG